MSALMHVSHECRSASLPLFPKFLLRRDSSALCQFSQCNLTPAVDEVSRSIIHLLRQVIKRCHSLPKLGLIIPAVQAVYPASCSSPLTDQDIQSKEREREKHLVAASPSTALIHCHIPSLLPFIYLSIYFPKWKKKCLPSPHMEF